MNAQQDLRFDGATYEKAHDLKRLSSQLQAVRDLMLDGRWRTISEVRSLVGGSENGISARLRDLRKSRFGSFVVERQRRGDCDRGVFEYRVLPGVSQ